MLGDIGGLEDISPSVGEQLDRLPSPPPSKKQKLGGYDFYRSIGSPRYVVAPMVDQSELAWRMLSRSPLPADLAGPSTTVRPSEAAGPSYTRHPGGAHLTYTPMIHAKIFAQAKRDSRGGDGQFDLTNGEEGSDEVIAGIAGGDRPLFVQFCANDPDLLLAAAKKVEAHCDAVDINFGCPQGIARRGHYGAFLQDDWELIQKLVGTLHANLSVPVTAKFRIHPDLDRTIAYAKMLEAAGAQILTCHGRTREMKGQATGLADWEIIRKVKEAVKVPVFANGNVLYGEDVERCLEKTGCDGVMTAEGNLSNPAIFLPPSHPYAHPPMTLLAYRYLDIVASLRTQTSKSAIKSHLFRLLKPVLDAQPDESLRISIAKAPGVEELREVVRTIEEMLKPEKDAAGPSWRPPPIDPATGYRDLPLWAVQPYIRPLARTIPAENGSTEDAVVEDTAATESGSQVLPAGISATTTTLHCIHPSCSHIAASKCPQNACITHCRAARAVEEDGMDPAEANRQAASGGLVGKGCEAHEEKALARKERMELKRQNAKAVKEARKVRKQEERTQGKRKAELSSAEEKAEGESRKKRDGREEAGWNSSLHGEKGDEEERFAAGITA